MELSMQEFYNYWASYTLRQAEAMQSNQAEQERAIEWASIQPASEILKHIEERFNNETA